MAYALNTFRIRVLLLIIFTLLMWQAFRFWPSLPTPAGVDFGTAAALPTERRRHNGTPVVVTVFYEALCPDSKNFVIRQLMPAYAKAPSLIDVVLVPFGKATTNHHSDGTIGFDCQHGPIECEANAYHACVIEAAIDAPARLDAIACMIQNNAMPKDAMLRCTHEHHIDSELVQKCVDSQHGAELLARYGEETAALQPAVSFIPTVTLDGSQGRQASILKDLLGEVCKLIGGHKSHPAVCPA